MKTSEQLKIAYESGENLECQAIYCEKRMKLSIGLYGETWVHYNGELEDCPNDYEIKSLEDRMSYCISEKTKTQRYTFGIAWEEKIKK